MAGSLEEDVAWVVFHIADVEDDPNDPEANRVALKLDADWSIKAGIAPDINSATVPYTEFDKLQQFVTPDKVGDPSTTTPQFHNTGSIEFYFSDQDNPDVVLDDIMIIQAEPVEIATTKTTAQDDEGNNVTDYVKRAVVYRLWFSDGLRRRLQPPRGGRLMLGLVNGRGAAADDIVSNSGLITKCCRALRLGDVDVPAIADNAPPMLDLQWMCVPAMDELGKLLDYVGLVFIPTSDPTLMLQPIGTGDGPTIPDAQKIPSTPIFNLDARGRTIIITSAPTPVLDTWDSSASDPPGWEFVARDKDGKWQSFVDLPELSGGAASKVSDHFAGIAADRAAVLYNDCFRYLRLDDERYDPSASSILRKRMLAVKSGDSFLQSLVDIQVSAAGAQVPIPTGGLKNGSGNVILPVIWMGSGTDGNVIGLHNRLGKLDNGQETSDPDKHFVEIVNFKVTFTIEATDPDVGGQLYFNVGFTKDSSGGGDENGIVQLDDSAVRSIMTGESDGGDAVIIPMPGLQYIRTNAQDNDDLKEKLTDQAKAYATQILAHSQDPIEVQYAVGFVPCQLSGSVSQIIYSQEKAMTTFHINRWYTPGFMLRKAMVDQMRKGAFPGQHEASASRTFLGTSGASHPSIPVGPPPLATSGGADAGNRDNPLGVGTGGEGLEPAMGDKWSLDENKAAVILMMMTRVAYFEGGDETLYGYVRSLSFDSSGRLYAIGNEQRVTIDIPDGCS